MRFAGRVTLLAVLLFGLAQAEPAAAAEDDFSLEPVVSGLSAPLAVVAEPGSERLFVVEKGGRIRIVNDGAITGTFLDIRGLVSSSGERGLLGLAFHPSYTSNRRLYVNYTNTSGDTRVVEYTARADRNGVVSGSAKVLVSIDQPASNHNGGHLEFGPDGYLYIASGDGGGVAGRANGQDTGTLLGGILRIDVETGGAPPDNPFVGAPGADALWVYGLRNPWRFTIDDATGDVVIGDVGQDRYEEIDLAHIDEGGVNFGWARTEGNACFSPPTGCSFSGIRRPIHVYSHSLGRSVTGGVVYRGSDLVGYEGHYFYGDFVSDWIRSFRISDGSPTAHTNWSARVGNVPGLASFGTDGDGELLVVSLNGTVYRLVGPDSPVGRFERLVVDGGVVTAVGWAFDPSMSSVSIPVHVYVDGRFGAGDKADRPRADVNRVFGITGSHGFRVGVDAGPGDRVCVYAINDGMPSAGGHTLLGCRTIGS